MFDTDAQRAIEGLTDRQRAVLEVVQSYAAQHGYPPTVREIGEILGLASSSTVHSHLAALERAGVLQRDATKPRAMRWGDTAGRVDAGVGARPTRIGGGLAGHAAEVEVETATAVPVVGRVAAGEPLLAEQHIEQYLPVPRPLLRDGECFVLKVRGESMVEAGILDGDWVVVRRQADCSDGQVVVALVDGEATCKRLRRRRGRVVLEPANAAMSPIEPEQCEIVGLVTGVMRAL